MANQITINIGAAANDGTGDPLRTAFNDVNLNFANVWSTGLPNSNIQFSDNRILTVNTNANLVLAPNGTGKVASNVDIVPNTANVFALGSSTRRWNTVYGQYLDLSHNATIGGNLVVTGNLSAGNISYTSNVFVGDLEGSVFDGASSIVLDVIDSAIYVDNYRYANGVSVTFGSNYSNANVAAYLPTYLGNISAGNVFVSNITTSESLYANSGTFYGDQYSDGAIYVGNPAGTVLGSDVVMQITANADGYSQTNFQNINTGNTATGDYIITADNGNDTTHFIDLGLTNSGWDGSETNVIDGLTPNSGYLYVQDGNLTVGTRLGSTSYPWKFDTNGTLTAPGNIIGGNLITSGLGYINYADSTQGYLQLSDGTNTGFLIGVGTNYNVWAGPKSLNLMTSGTGNLGFFVSQTERGRFTTTGLDVSGTVSATGTITTTVVKTTPVTANLLPSAATVGAGARAFVTDADVNVFGNSVVGGGIYYVPVFSNGSSWYIG